MCNYTQVAYCCGHCRYTVRAWCYDYEKTHKRCPVHVVAVERRVDERCGDCQPAHEAPWMDHFYVSAIEKGRASFRSPSMRRLPPASPWGSV